MNESPRIDFELILADRLLGKMNLIQSMEDREAIVFTALEALLAEPGHAETAQDLGSPDKRVQFVKDFLSYGWITNILCDFHVEDIIINALNPIYVHHSQEGFISTGQRFTSHKELDLFIKKLLIFAGRTRLEKIVNFELPNLDGRVNISRSPFGPQITIAKAKITPLSIIDLIRAGSMSYEVAAQLWMYVEGMSIRPANIIIAGGPGVGKTTLLNALFGFIPEKDRIVVIEDTLELNTFLEESCSRLESDEDVSLADLVKNSLRMRPERVVIGEVRGEEAADMITACNIGKHCIGTIHALTSREAIVRLQNQPMNIPEGLISLIDVFIVLKRYHVGDKMFRVVDEISETSGMEQVKVLLSQVYKYNYETMQFRQTSPSTVYRDRLSQQSGLQAKDIMREHILRAHLLQKLDQKNFSSLKEVAVFCRLYNKNPNDAAASVGLDRKKFLAASL